MVARNPDAHPSSTPPRKSGPETKPLAYHGK
jgi:hypothetical protein